ncbi:tRNA (adenosine(37)-N6)-dimethylallyltransferase MiaA [Paucihalobacter sp.]|uniref:tRNA (adenosine(37)-N6)-dimethylallyltransferase MiaA n=1 Tax=Paucihalobacter sp. TaxID=2850405 RepID=UPI002FE046DB
MTRFLICVLGPTAIGKTALSIKLAQHFTTEIISADSRQFFKELSIGTAAPSPGELASAKHHFIHHKSINDNYNVGAFERDAISLLNEKFNKNPLMIMVGGSGLYIDAVIKGLDDFPDIDPNIRVELNQKLEKQGLESLQKQLEILDKTIFDQISIDNPHRIIRALEICIGTGKPYSSFLKTSNTKRDFDIIKIGLTADREEIYNRINQRVDDMVAAGLVEEATSLFTFKHLNALNTVGYKEIFAYLEGEYSLDFAISEIKKNSRRFAKRQMTWFKKDESIQWFHYKTSTEDIIEYIENKMTK